MKKRVQLRNGKEMQIEITDIDWEKSVDGPTAGHCTLLMIDGTNLEVKSPRPGGSALTAVRTDLEHAQSEHNHSQLAKLSRLKAD